jgi:NADPH-dependent curcumin reductase CurA
MCPLYIRIQVLKKEFPRGVDIIYESVGGGMFDLCLNALAVHGHLIVIGMISQVILAEPQPMSFSILHCDLRVATSEGEHVNCSALHHSEF